MDERTKQKLIDKGYRVDYDRYGYMVYHNDTFVYGAGVNGQPKMHWRHIRANVKDNHDNGWRMALEHANKNKIIA